MKYENTPRPEIEHHFHIRDLIEGQEKRTADVDYHRSRIKGNEERDKEITLAKVVEIKDFWCNECEEDFTTVGMKHIDSWTPIAYYKTKHECGNWCMRHITDKHKDVYWFESMKVAKDKASHSVDMLQPHESNFQLMYGKKI